MGESGQQHQKEPIHASIMPMTRGEQAWQDLGSRHNIQGSEQCCRAYYSSTARAAQNDGQGFLGPQRELLRTEKAGGVAHLWGKVLRLVGNLDPLPEMLSRQAGASSYVLQRRPQGLVTE